MKITEKGWDWHADLKLTPQSYCQSCRKKFKHLETVFFAWLDNTIICRECTKAHAEAEPRLYVKGEGANE